METIHIFDEFKHTPSEITSEEKHNKRVKLEPLIFDILKTKYGTTLKSAYKSYTPPLQGEEKGCIFIIERRIHENLQFILHNAAWAAPPGWRIGFICSDVNEAYCKKIGEGKALLIPLFKGSPGRDDARNEYNNALKSSEFYRSLPSENLLFLQTDSYLRKQIPDFIMDYDFIGSPFAWDEINAGGGTTFRKRSVMIDICERFDEDIPSEDLFISKGIRELNYQMPDFMDGITYFTESCLYEDPIGVHQWWTFFCPGVEDAEFFFKCLLTLEVESKSKE
jgi:hypothetical protein